MLSSEETTARFVVGIDLGTTNSSMAFVDTEAGPTRIRDFPIPQLIAPATVEARETLPSFHYEAAAGEFADGALRLPWGFWRAIMARRSSDGLSSARSRGCVIRVSIEPLACFPGTGRRMSHGYRLSRSVRDT